jgi:hypothetical protein
MGLLENPSDVEWYWLGYYAAALANPGKDTIPVLLEHRLKWGWDDEGRGAGRGELRSCDARVV